MCEGTLRFAVNHTKCWRPSWKKDLLVKGWLRSCMLVKGWLRSCSGVERKEASQTSSHQQVLLRPIRIYEICWSDGADLKRERKARERLRSVVFSVDFFFFLMNPCSSCFLRFSVYLLLKCQTHNPLFMILSKCDVFMFYCIMEAVSNVSTDGTNICSSYYQTFSPAPLSTVQICSTAILVTW